MRWIRTCACCALLVASTCVQAASGGVVRIAVLLDYAGGFGDVGGQGALIAAEMAVKHVAGEVADTPIEVVPVDSAGGETPVAEALREQHAATPLDAVIAVTSAATAVTAHQFASAHDVLFIHNGGATRELTSEYCAPTAFQWVPPMYSYAAGIRDGYADRDVETWFFLAPGEGQGQEIRRTLEAAFLMSTSRVVGVAEYEPGSRDMEPYVELAIATRADVIGMVEPGESTLAALRSAYELGRAPRSDRVAAMQLTISDIRRIGLYVAGGLRLVVPFLWNADAVTERWSRAFRSRSGAMPTSLQAGTYSAVTHYLEGVAAVSSDAVQKVAEAMRAAPVDDIYAHGGRIGEDGQLIKPMYFVEVKQPGASREAWDYFSVIDRFPAARVFPIEREGGCGG